MNPLAGEFRVRLIEAVRRTPEDSALLFSGGIDSAAVLGALVALGREPHLFTANLGLEHSPDTTVAAAMAGELRLPHVIVHVNRDYETLENTVRRVVRETGRTEKRHVEVVGSLYWLLPYMQGMGFRNALSGMTAGDAFGDSRKARMIRYYKGEEAAREYSRPDILYHKADHTDWTLTKLAWRGYGIRIWDAYRLKPLRPWLLGTTMADLHGNGVKTVATDAFPEVFAGHPEWLREHANLQIVGGFREWFGTLIASPLNRGGYRAVAPIYRDILREERAGVTPLPLGITDGA